MYASARETSYFINICGKAVDYTHVRIREGACFYSLCAFYEVLLASHSGIPAMQEQPGLDEVISRCCEFMMCLAVFAIALLYAMHVRTHTTIHDRAVGH